MFWFNGQVGHGRGGQQGLQGLAHGGQHVVDGQQLAQIGVGIFCYALVKIIVHFHQDTSSLFVSTLQMSSMSPIEFLLGWLVVVICGPIVLLFARIFYRVHEVYAILSTITLVIWAVRIESSWKWKLAALPTFLFAAWVWTIYLWFAVMEELCRVHHQCI